MKITEELDGWLRSQPVSAATRNGHRRHLGVLFSYGVRRGWARENPVKQLAKAEVASDSSASSARKRSRGCWPAPPRRAPVGVKIGLERRGLVRDVGPVVMKEATVEELLNRPAEVWAHVEAGEAVIIARAGVVVARLVPAAPAPSPPGESAVPDVPPGEQVDWTQSAGYNRDRTGERMLSADESLALVREAAGRY